MLPLRGLKFGFWVVTINLGLITSDDGLNKFWVMICKIERVLRNFLMEFLFLLHQQLQDKFSGHSLQVQISEWNVLILCLFPLLQQFLVPLSDDPPALFCELDQSPPPFGLFVVFPSGDHSPLMHGHL